MEWKVPTGNEIKGSYIIEITDDFVEESKAFSALVVDRIFGVEVRKVWHRCKHNTRLRVALSIQFLGIIKNTK